MTPGLRKVSLHLLYSKSLCQSIGSKLLGCQTSLFRPQTCIPDRGIQNRKVPQPLCDSPASNRPNRLEFKAQANLCTSWTFQLHLPLSLFTYHFLHLNERHTYPMNARGASSPMLLLESLEECFSTLAACFNSLGGLKSLLMLKSHPYVN